VLVGQFAGAAGTLASLGADVLRVSPPTDPALGVPTPPGSTRC